MAGANRWRGIVHLPKREQGGSGTDPGTPPLPTPLLVEVGGRDRVPVGDEEMSYRTMTYEVNRPLLPTSTVPYFPQNRPLLPTESSPTSHIGREETVAVRPESDPRVTRLGRERSV